MHGGIPSLPQYVFMAWCLVKFRDNFTFTFTFRWEDNIKITLREIGWEGVEWIHLAQDRDQWRDSCQRGNEPSGSTKGREFLD
jgi:hypothetical protein